MEALPKPMSHSAEFFLDVSECLLRATIFIDSHALPSRRSLALRQLDFCWALSKVFSDT